MIRRFILAAATLSIPCCITSCGSQFTQTPLGRSIQAIGYGALQGANSAAVAELGKYQPVQPTQPPAAKAPQTVLP